jgi:hypothetical protein
MVGMGSSPLLRGTNSRPRRAAVIFHEAPFPTLTQGAPLPHSDGKNDKITSYAVVPECGKWVSGYAGDAERCNLVVRQVGCSRSGGKSWIGHLLFCNLTERFAADSLQVQQLETIDTRLSCGQGGARWRRSSSSDQGTRVRPGLPSRAGEGPDPRARRTRLGPIRGDGHR